MSNTPAERRAAAPAQLEEKTIVDRVQNSINSLVEQGNLELPKGYAASTALREAYLVLRETEDRNHRPALEVCTQESIAAALLETVVCGFSPARKHCYYIVYGKQLVCQRSYFGSQLLAYRLNPWLGEINAELIFEGDEVQINIFNGKKYVTSHKQKFQPETTIDKIIGAYAVAVGKNGEIANTVVMSKSDILKSWKQSKQKPVQADGSVKPDSVHGKFPGEMAKRTAINRLCKTLINTSPDTSYLTEIIGQSESLRAEAEISAEIEENANTLELDFEGDGEAVETTADEGPASEEAFALTPEEEAPPAEPSPAPEPTKNDEFDPGF